MPNPRLASRYAKSLLDIAIEQNALAATYEDVQYIAAVCSQSREFANLLRSPIIKGDKKLSIIDSVMKANISKLTHAFIALLINKGREAFLPEMVVAFAEQYRRLQKIKPVKLVTAVPASDKLKESVKAKFLAAHPDNTVELETIVNPALIGGFVIEADGKIYDASISKQLNDIKTNFAGNVYVSKLN